MKLDECFSSYFSVRKLIRYIGYKIFISILLFSFVSMIEDITFKKKKKKKLF